MNNWYSMVCSFQMYCDPDCKPWTSRSWAPPGYASRQDAEAEVHDTERLARVDVHESDPDVREKHRVPTPTKLA